MLYLDVQLSCRCCVCARARARARDGCFVAATDVVADIVMMIVTKVDKFIIIVCVCVCMYENSIVLNQGSKREGEGERERGKEEERETERERNLENKKLRIHLRHRLFYNPQGSGEGVDALITNSTFGGEVVLQSTYIFLGG